MGVFAMIVTYICVLALLFGGLCFITGEKKKSAVIFNYCATALILMAVVLMCFSFKPDDESVFSYALPFVMGVMKYGSVSNFFGNATGEFALAFVELVTLLLIVNWASGWLNLKEGGLVGLLISKFVIFFAGCIGYGFFMEFVGGNVVFQWFVYAVECIITGSAILYTPALLLSTYLNIKEGTFLSTYILSILPETSLGKAISTSVSTAIASLIAIAALETQSGSITNVLSGTLDAIKSFGGCIVLIFGLYFIVRSVTK